MRGGSPPGSPFLGAAADLAETLWQRPLSVAGELPPLCSAVAFLWRDTSGWAEQLGAATGVQKQWVAKEARQPWVVLPSNLASYLPTYLTSYLLACLPTTY